MYGPVHSRSICVLPLTEILFQFERVHLHKQPAVFVVHQSHPCQLLSDPCGSSGSQLCQTDCASELSIQSDRSKMVLVRHRRWSHKLHLRPFGIKGRTVEEAKVEDNGWGRSNKALKQVGLAETPRIRSCEKIREQGHLRLGRLRSYKSISMVHPTHNSKSHGKPVPTRRAYSNQHLRVMKAAQKEPPTGNIMLEPLHCQRNGTNASSRSTNEREIEQRWRS